MISRRALIAGATTLSANRVLALTPSQEAVLFNGIKPAYVANLLSGRLPSGLSFAHAGNAMQYDATGKLTYAPNNLMYPSNPNSSYANSASYSFTSGVTDPFGGTGAVTLTANSASKQLYSYSLVQVAPTAISSVWLRRRTGTGTVLAVNANNTATDITSTLNGTWQQFYSRTTTANAGNGAYIGIQINTIGDQVDWYLGVIASVTYETTPRPQDQVVTTSAAYYGPRFDYNPNTLAPNGLLIEGAATNLLAYSSAFTNAAWSQQSTTAAQNVTGPDGVTNSGATLTMIAATGLHDLASSAFTSNTQYALSIYAKAGTARYISLSIAGSNDGAYATYDLQSGVVTQSGALSAGTLSTTLIQSIGNGWYRLVIVGKTASAAPYMIIAGANAGTYTPDGYGRQNYTAAGTETYLIFGAQLEAGSFASSYIPTGASAVTRAADIVTFTGSALTLLQGTQGAAIVQMISEGSTNPTTITNIIKGTNSILYRDTTGKLGTTNGTTALLTSGAPTWTSAQRVGLSWSPGKRGLDYTGVAPTNDNNSASNGGTIYLGSSNGSAAENGWYQSFGLYNQPLPNSALQSKIVVGAPY